jgi:hypothetical protein
MDDYFALSRDEQRGYCELAAAQIKLDAPSIEKDFWVCWILRETFLLPKTGSHLTFKGGTSLSKGWRLIQRFSEDIDVVIAREFLGFGGDKAPEAAESKKQREARLEALRDACGAYVQTVLTGELRERLQSRLPTHIEWTLQNDPNDPDQQSLLFTYPSAFSRGAYLNPQVKLEFGARSDTEPSARPMIQPYLAEALPGELKDATFPIHTVAPERTFWEKAMLLHEENYSNKPKPNPRMARHYYDLWCLLGAGIGDKAVVAPGLFESVAHHRAIFFRKKKEAQDSLQPGALAILPREDRRAAWEQDYEAMQAAMFFGAVPSFAEILSKVGEFESRFNKTVR